MTFLCPAVLSRRGRAHRLKNQVREFKTASNGFVNKFGHAANPDRLPDVPGSFCAMVAPGVLCGWIPVDGLPCASISTTSLSMSLTIDDFLLCGAREKICGK
jgi:hypothetical protein